MTALVPASVALDQAKMISALTGLLESIRQIAQDHEQCDCSCALMVLEVLNG